MKGIVSNEPDCLTRFISPLVAAELSDISVKRELFPDRLVFGLVRHRVVVPTEAEDGCYRNPTRAWGVDGK